MLLIAPVWSGTDIDMLLVLPRPNTRKHDAVM